MLLKAKCWSQRPQKNRIKQVCIGHWFQRAQGFTAHLLINLNRTQVGEEGEQDENLFHRKAVAKTKLITQSWWEGPNFLNKNVLIYRWRIRISPFIMMKQHFSLKHSQQVNCLVNCPLESVWHTKCLHTGEKWREIQTESHYCYLLLSTPAVRKDMHLVLLQRDKWGSVNGSCMQADSGSR